MGLLDNTIQPSPPTREQILSFIRDRILRTAVTSFKTISEIQKTGIDLVWNNPQFTPQEIVDALGEDAIKIFQYHGELTDYLTSIAALDGVEYVPAKPSNAFSVVDGKIVISDQPYK